MTDLVEGLGEVENDGVLLVFFLRFYGRLVSVAQELSLTGSPTSEVMLLWTEDNVFFSRCDMVAIVTMCSISLQVMQAWEIGR